MADAMTTSQFQEIEGVYEKNGILGSQPSTRSVSLYFAGLMLIHHFVLKKYPEVEPYWSTAFTVYYLSLAYDNCQRTGKC